MAEEGFKRKLAAILSTDVEGYNHIMRDDGLLNMLLSSPIVTYNNMKRKESHE
jgi:hypothetical protein